MKNLTIREIKDRYSFIENYFGDIGLKYSDDSLTLEEIIDRNCDEEGYILGTTRTEFESKIYDYIDQMVTFLGIEDEMWIKSLTILPGVNKSGETEKFESITINRSEIITIVGPTGSGKSRLLADIEWAANRDTPTKRKILINGKDAETKWRFSSNNKLVAQLSQNMNYIMDLSVEEFLRLHGESKFLEDVDGVVEKILNAANKLAGEKFERTTPITSLSGGQSRALMIADTAILSSAPIVLIDEIENAGIDRKKALDLLVSEDKIVLMATHDPYLALTSDKRIVIGNGGIVNIIETTDEEREISAKLDVLDEMMTRLREDLRDGKKLDKNVFEGRL